MERARREPPNLDFGLVAIVRALGLADDLLKASTDLRKDQQSPKTLAKRAVGLTRNKNCRQDKA
jgi:hypothetical protein